MDKPKKIPKLTAFFYQTSLGTEPVRDWLTSLAKLDRQRIGEGISYVQFKWPIGKPHVDHLCGAIWEVRITLRSRIARVLFSVVDDEMILLHGFIKKTQRTEKNEINLAEIRFKDWIENHEKK